MPKIEYEATGQEKGTTYALFNYKLTIDIRGTTTHTRKVVIQTEEIDGRWKSRQF